MAARRTTRKAEARTSIEDPKVPLSSPNILQIFGWADNDTAGENVTAETAMSVPAVWS